VDFGERLGVAAEARKGWATIAVPGAHNAKKVRKIALNTR
jgi:hypothetical protein